MRNLSSYLNRRNIRTQEERDAWAAENGIDSHAKLIQFCESRELKCTGTWHFRAQTSRLATASLAEERAPLPAEEGADATWHTPAALRPLKKSAPLPKKAAKSKKPSSRKPRSRKKPAPHVEPSEE